jgi:putative redox protein
MVIKSIIERELPMAPITVRLGQGYQTAIHIRQHTVMADELISDGGTDCAPTPMEILLGTVGGCIAVTTQAYAQRKGWPLEGVSVELDMERINREDYPTYSGAAAFVHEIREKIHFDGPLTDEQKSRLKFIAGKCPVHLVLEYPVFFVSDLVDGQE